MKRTLNDVYITLGERNTISIVVSLGNGDTVEIPLTLAEADALKSWIIYTIHRATTERTEAKL